MSRKILKLSDYAKKHGVTVRTVWNWFYKGLIKIEKLTTGLNFVVEEDNSLINKVAIYARVSSSENKDNLEKQKNRLLDYCNAKGYIVEQVVCEIGSGLNDKRPKLEKLLTNRTINVIVVEHSDRFCRFGFNYIEKLMENDNRYIEVVNPPENIKEDLMEDFVSIITSFTARLYGLRRTKRKTEKLIQELSCN